MPTLPSPPTGIARLTVEGSLNGHRWANVFWVFIPSWVDVSVSNWQDYVAYFGGQYALHFNDCMSSSVNIDKVSGYIWLDDDEVLFAEEPLDQDGGRSATVSNVGACSLIHWGISRRYRGGKPRTYLPGLADADVVGGFQLSDTQQGRLATRGAEFISAISSSAGPLQAVLGVLRRYHNNVPLEPPVFDPFQSARGVKMIATQRRRIRN